MKRLLLVSLAFILLCLPADLYARGACAAAAGGGAVALTYPCTDATHDSANTAITVCEDMQGAVDCDAGAGTQNFCRAGYTVSAVTFNASGIEGTYSADIDCTSAASYFYHAVSAADSYSVFIKIKVVAWPTGSAKAFLSFNASGAVQGSVSLDTDGQLIVIHGTDNATTVDAMAEGGTYYLWATHTKGTGADGVISVEFASDMTKVGSGNKYAATDQGSTTSQINRIMYGYAVGASPLHIQVDHIRVNTTAFGSNPP